MMKQTLLLLVLSIVSGSLSAAVEYDAQIPQVAFAAQEIKEAQKDSGREDLQVRLIIEPNKASPEAFQIRSVGPTMVEVNGLSRHARQS